MILIMTRAPVCTVNGSTGRMGREGLEYGRYDGLAARALVCIVKGASSRIDRMGREGSLE